jgi:hypothetical protein
LEKFAFKNFNRKRIIAYSYHHLTKEKAPVSLTLDDLLTHTNFTSQLLKYKIKYIFIPYRSSKKLENWSKRQGIQLIVTPFFLQNNFENKKYFDNFLKRYKLSSPQTIIKNDIINSKNYVIQEAKVSNYFKSHFFQSGGDLSRYLNQKKLPGDKFVIREYLAGWPVGVSLFIDKAGNYFFSALRRQCFKFYHGFPKEFIGIQWLATDFFKTLVNKRIGLVLKKLSRVLIKDGFYGVANIDLIIYNNQAFVLECNPRLSMAMPHIFSFLALTTYINPWQFFLNIFYRLKKYLIHQSDLPLSHFRGSVLDIENKMKIVVNNPLPIGIYKIANNQITFISDKLKDFNHRKDYFFLFHELEKGQILGRGFSLCTIFSNFPLFNAKEGTLNYNGNKLYNYFSQAFIP